MSTATLPAAELEPRTYTVPSDLPLLKPASTRLVSIDAYRGLAMLLMASEGLAVAGVVHANHLTTGYWPALAFHTDHVQWRGCALWDMIQPSFTFIVGLAMPFSLAKRRSTGQRFGRLLFHAVVRSLILIALGIFLRSINRSTTNFTFEDTLTQIGLGYTFAFLLAWIKPRWQAAAVAIILVAYWLAFALYPLPPADFDYASVGVSPQWRAAHGLTGFAAHWDKNTNFAAAFDARFLNLFHRDKPFKFNPGGYLTLSFIPTLATILLGLLAGQWLRDTRVGAPRKITVLIVAGALGIAAGWLLDRTGICPNVKRIWTPSWVLFSGGVCSILTAAFYLVIDVWRLRAWAFPLVVVGMNSIAMYCMADGGFRRFLQDSLKIHHASALWSKAGIYAPIAEMSITLLLLWLVTFWMYRRKLFLRI